MLICRVPTSYNRELYIRGETCTCISFYSTLSLSIFSCSFAKKEAAIFNQTTSPSV